MAGRDYRVVVNEGQQSIRVSDRDRDRYQQVLTTAYAEGRLDESEFEERLARVLDAKFEADLAPLVTDLPAGNHLTVADVEARQPAVDVGPDSEDVESNDKGLGRGLAFMTAPIICTAIYAMTDFGGYFWPMWVWFGCSIPALRTVLSRR